LIETNQKFLVNFDPRYISTKTVTSEFRTWIAKSVFPVSVLEKIFSPKCMWCD